jgi:hypothetical protein
MSTCNIATSVPLLLQSDGEDNTISRHHYNDNDDNNKAAIDDHSKMISWKKQYHNTMYEQMKCLCFEIQSIPGLSIPTLPNAAMYTMVQIHLHEYFDSNVIKNDIDFTQLLYKEENVLVLPGSCFFAKTKQNHQWDHDAIKHSMTGHTIINQAIQCDDDYTHKRCIPKIIQQDSSNGMIDLTDDHTNHGELQLSSSSSNEYYFRIVFCAPCQQLIIATERLRQFCLRYQNKRREKTN